MNYIPSTTHTKTNGRPLPKGWQWVKLGYVCEFLDARRKPINETERTKRIQGKHQNELFPYYGANGQVGWIDGYLFDEPLILLAEDGGFLGQKINQLLIRFLENIG